MNERERRLNVLLMGDILLGLFVLFVLARVSEPWLVQLDEKYEFINGFYWIGLGVSRFLYMAACLVITAGIVYFRERFRVVYGYWQIEAATRHIKEKESSTVSGIIRAVTFVWDFIDRSTRDIPYGVRAYVTFAFAGALYLGAISAVGEILFRVLSGTWPPYL